MIFLELHEALLNIDTTDDYEKQIVFGKLYRFIYDKGLLCFDPDGKVMNMDGAMLIKQIIDYYSEKRWEERCWWMKKYLMLYESRFKNLAPDENQAGPVEFYLPLPKASWIYPDIA